MTSHITSEMVSLVPRPPQAFHTASDKSLGRLRDGRVPTVSIVRLPLGDYGGISKLGQLQITTSIKPITIYKYISLQSEQLFAYYGVFNVGRSQICSVVRQQSSQETSG